MPKLTSNRYVGMPKTNGHDQTMGLAQEQHKVRLAIEAAQAAGRASNKRLADLAARSDKKKPARAHCVSQHVKVVVSRKGERTSRASQARRRMLAVCSAK